MHPVKSLPFFTLMLLISFAAVNAVLFTPALPNITEFLGISKSQAQLTISLFLMGYAFGQLVYGPIANRYGRKPALYGGIITQIFSSFLCVIAGKMQSYEGLVIARLLLALGSGVGLKMTFTLVNECYEPKAASQKISYLLLAFAITPGLSVALGGWLNQHFGWASCFYASALYGIWLLVLITRLPETLAKKDYHAFELKHLTGAYIAQFRNKMVLVGGCLIGSSSCFLYVFSAIAPFVAIQMLGMNSADYGFANLIPSIGLVLGSLVSAHFAKYLPLKKLIAIGISITAVGISLSWVAFLLHPSVIVSIFLPMIVIYFGLCFIIGNASSIALSQTEDKAHGSAVINFINMSFSMLAVLCLSLLPIKLWLMPTVFLLLVTSMICSYRWLQSLCLDKKSS